MAAFITDVLVDGVTQSMNLSGTAGGSCGSKYCRLCHVAAGKTFTAPTQKLKAKASDADKKKRPGPSRAPVGKP